MKKTNPELHKTVEVLRKRARADSSNLWLRLAEDLAKPTRSRIVVNIARINKHAADGETIIVPGKVLASGELDKKITVIAWQFSGSAKKKIAEKGTAIELADVLNKPLEGKIRILG